ncbi:glycine-rich domain-containing protein [Serratia fonticola]
MQKIGNVTETADANGEFTDGRVAQGITPTILPAAIFNTWQRELVNIVEGAGIVLDPQNDGQVLEAINKHVSSGRLLNIQRFIINGIYTPTIGAKKVRIKAWGGGGAGGGTPSITTTQSAVAGGGAAGAYVESFIDVPTLPLSVLVGKGGIAATGVDGESGGSTIVGNITAPGGPGGAVGVASAAFPFGASPKNPTIGTGGNILNAPGGAASMGFTWSNGGAIRSMGGQSEIGSSQYAADAIGNCAGGAGAVAAGSTGAQAALAGYGGAPGLVIIEEYA